MSSFGISRLASRLALGAILMGALGGAGCAEERDPINKVQANALPKSFFIGKELQDPQDDPEFYWRNYVVDASASQSLIGVGSWGHVDRIRWEVTEDLLIARKAYQIADGQDNKGVPQKDPFGREKSDKGFTKTPNGTIVAAYKIEKHFDIRHSYNPQTGEELNVVEENDSDRPWNQREHMRVDWSKNLASDTNPMWDEMFTGKVFGNFEVLPVSYAVTDPNSDDRLQFDDKTGYLDVTNKYTLTPATSASPFSDYGGKVPTCIVVGLFTGSSTYECDPQEATVRSSFQKIDQNHDFEPLENTTATMDVVGNPGGIGDSRSVGVVSAGRQSWDPQYGFTDGGYHRFAYVHNVWKKSHQDVSCTADDQCANETTGYKGHSGSTCDVHVKKCTIPYRDREVKTVGYWVNKEAPDELQDPIGPDGKPSSRGTLEDLTYSWNQLMRVAVATSREVECRRTGDGDKDSCHAEFFDSTNDPSTKEMVSYGGWLVEKTKDPKAVLTMCHNPVREYDDHETCGETGAKARVGDIRKNFIFYWPYDSRAPWGGIADWNADPLTGEIIGAAAQIMGRSATFAAAQQRDIISLELGDVKIEDLIEGSQEARFAKALTDGRKGETPRALTPEEMKTRISNVDKAHLVQSLGAHPSPGKNQGEKLLAALKRDREITDDPRVASTALLEYDALAKNLRGTKYEAELVDSHYLVGAIGASPTASLDDSLMEAASPLRGMDPGRMHAMKEAATAGLHARGVCFMDAEAPAVGSIFLGSLAGYFKQKYGTLDATERGKRIYDDLWKDAVKGIALHEIGHSLGMLHQFASSWDSPNYNPQYWQLRTNEGQSTASCDGKPRTGANDSCMGPRYLDPETDDELGRGSESRPGILYFANTSTMEYQIERAGETVGLGTYDQHAMKALYGRVLETFDSSVMKPAAQQDFRFKNWSQLVDGDLVVDGNSIKTVHYTELARRMKVFDAKRDCRPATEEEKATAGWRVVHGKVCAPPPKDHARWRDFKSDSVLGTDEGFNAPYWHVVDESGTERVRWPYRWGTSHNSYYHTNDSDAGADPYEVAVNTRKKFEATYPWTYFRRTNREYNYRGIPSTVADRYFDRMRSYHWQIATDLARGADDAALEDDNDMRPVMMAQQEVFDLLARALLMPEPGTYYDARTTAETASRQPTDSIKTIFDTARNVGGGPGAPRPAFSIGIGEGRFIGEDYNNTLGGSWDYLNFINHAGFTVEKALALQALVDGRPSLSTITRDNFLDGRAMKVNFRNDLPHAVDRLIGGILAEDWESIAPGVAAGNTDDARPLMLDLTKRTLAPTRPADALVVFPNLGYKQQLATAMYTALFSRLSTDMGLMNKMRVWIDGQVGQVAIPEAEQVRYTDPSSGYTYVARKYGTENIDGKLVDRGIASRMIAHANAMLAAAYEIDDAPVTTGNTVVTPASRDSFGRPRLKKDANGQPIVKSPEAAGQLDKYVGLVDALREIESKLGYGPLAGGNNGGDD